MIFNIHGLVFEVVSQDPKFLDYLGYRFQKFVSKEKQIKIKFNVKFKKPSIDLSSYERISYNFYSKKNQFIIKKENVIIFYDLSGAIIKVTIYFFPKNPKHLARLILKGRRNTLRDYYEHFIIWRGIQNTLLSLLEQKNLSVLHSSAIKSNNGATLFFGLGGVGKTTVALSHLFSNNFKLMGDNFILIDGDNAYPFLEPITLTKFKRDKLTLSRIKQVMKKNKTFNSYFPRDEKSYNNFCPIKNIIFLTASKEDTLTKINKSESLNLINSTLKILGETPEFTELNMIFPKKTIKLGSKVNYYKMSYKDLIGAKKLLSNIL